MGIAPTRIGTGRLITSMSAWTVVAALLTTTGWAAGAETKPTHQLIDKLDLTDEAGQTVVIRTFCVSPQGELLVACGGTKTQYVRVGQGYERQRRTSPAQIRLVSSDGQTVSVVSTPFPADAINVGADGSVYIGGDGQVARFDKQMKLVKSVDSPAKTLLLTQMQGQIEKARTSAQADVQRYQEKVDAVKAELAEPDLSEEQKQSLKRRLEFMGQRLDRLAARLEEAQTQVMESVKGKMDVTGIACSGDDLFVCCDAVKGHGYAIYRMTTDLADAELITRGLSGCCGQLDIQAHDGKVYAAENSRMRVLCFDREGKKLSSWGKSARRAGSQEGFGSCCNPMNIRFGDDGICYTSEASVGSIKRFTADGEYLGLVCNASDIPSCKHTPIGISPDGRRVYMLDSPKSRILVFQQSNGEGQDHADQISGE